MKKPKTFPSFSAFPANHAPFLPSLQRQKYSLNDIRKAFIQSNPVKFKEQSPAFFRYKVNYPELIAKSCNEDVNKNVKASKTDSSKWLPHCSFSLIRTKCTLKIPGINGHLISKALFCGREWCATCGQKKSIIHQRRISRWIPKSKQIETMGYLVITIPKEIRANFSTKFDLNNFRTYIRRKLKRENLCNAESKGLIRYHFAGDCKVCKGKKCDSCNYTGADREYHPHINILINTSGFIEQKKINAFKKELGDWFTSYTKIDCTGKGNINYQYTKNDNKKKHWISYVTRATWRFYDPKICTLIKGFHVSSTFGKFEKTIPETTAEAIAVNCCPICLKDYGLISKLKKIAVTSKDDFKFTHQSEISPGIFYQFNST